MMNISPFFTSHGFSGAFSRSNLTSFEGEIVLDDMFLARNRSGCRDAKNSISLTADNF